MAEGSALLFAEPDGQHLHQTALNRAAEAVSYTHLDVYKRQPRISGLRKAKEKPILVMNENDLGLPSDFKAIAASPTRIVKVEKSVSWGRKVKWVDAQEIKRVLVER